MRWWTSDQHYGHENIIKYCERPFPSKEEMDRTLLYNHNSKVRPNDEVFILGDFSMKNEDSLNYFRTLLKKLNGTKHLILGNHDKLKPFTYIDIGFTSVHTSLELYINNIRFLMAHDPVTSLVDRDAIWLCGHAHNLFKTLKNIINVGVDVWDFYPVSEENIFNLLKKNSPT